MSIAELSFELSFCAYFSRFFVDLVVSRGATNGLETLVSEMVYHVLRGHQTLLITIFYLVTV